MSVRPDDLATPHPHPPTHPTPTPHHPPPPPEQTFLLDSAYAFMVANVRSTTSHYNLPLRGLLALGIDYQL